MLHLNRRVRPRTWDSPAPRGTRLRPQESFLKVSALLSCPDGTCLPRSFLSALLEPLYPGSKLTATTWCLYRSGALINQPESNLTQAHRKKLRGSAPWDILNRQHKPVPPPSRLALYLPHPSPFLPKPSDLHTQESPQPSGPESSTRTAGGLAGQIYLMLYK